MKTYVITFLLTISSLVANELSWVDEQVNAIKPNRVGTTNSSISKITSPFVYLKKNVPKDAKTNKVNKSATSIKTKSYTPTRNYSSSNRTSKKAKRIKLKPPFSLSAIINSSALINGKWYKVGDKVKRYKIMDIGKRSITLSRNKITTVLKIKSTNKLNFK